MREAVIVSTARTGLAKAGARRVQHDLQRRHAGGGHRTGRQARALRAPEEIEDVVAGQVAASGNVARSAALLAGLPVTTSGVTVNRACSSGLNAIAMAARYIIDDGCADRGRLRRRQHHLPGRRRRRQVRRG